MERWIFIDLKQLKGILASLVPQSENIAPIFKTLKVHGCNSNLFNPNSMSELTCSGEIDWPQSDNFRRLTLLGLVS